VLIVFQLSLSLVLLIAAGLFINSLDNLQGVNAGFDPDNLLFITINPSLVGYSEPRLSTAYSELLGRIREVPGIISASLSSHGLVAPGVDDSGFTVPGRTPRAGEARGVDLNMVGPDFFTTTRTPISLGRGITAEDQQHTLRVCVITESLARQYFSGQNPLGKHASLGGPPVEIVGVSKDVKYNSLHDESSRVVFLPYRQLPPWHPPIAETTFVVRTKERDLEVVASTIRQQISGFDRSLPIVAIKTAKTQIAESLVQERLLAWLSGGFGTLGLLLACLGVIGTMAHAVARRTNEIGIRMAIGAERRQVLWMFVREAVVLSIAGSLLGITLAYLLSRLATSLLFAVKPTDSRTMVAAAILLTVSVIGAALFPSWRASRVDPVIALRCE
jgi:predicted permease